ncbi:MAG: ATP-binding cassette domain-containing protein [Actinobacteria bacterium]|nr:ATP-binding cassette domain-containing protein [Actinomycetota bacterium]
MQVLEAGRGLHPHRLPRLVTLGGLGALEALAPSALVIGALTGLAYGVLAAGLILVYRSSGILNFAHGEIGAFGAAVLAKVVLDNGVPFFVALPLVLVLGAVVGVAVQSGVVRRLRNQSRVVVLVATIGVSQLLLVAQALIPEVDQVSAYPTPLDRTIRIGSVLLASEHFLALAFIPAAVIGLSLLLARTPTGVAIRAVADNRDGAELAGISSQRVAMVVWALAGVLATLTAVLIAPLRGEQVGTLDAGALGAGLLLRALAAGLLGRLVSLPLALLGGVVVGMAEAVLLFNGVSPGAVEATLFVAVLALVLVGGREAETAGATVAWAAPSGGPLRPRPLPPELAGRRWARRLGPAVWMAMAAMAGALPFVVSSSGALFRATAMLLYAVIGLSVVVLTGWGGQLSLGQFAIAGVGAFVTGALVERGVAFPTAVVEAVIAGVVVALVIGIPALRVRGLFLAVTTLAFAVAAREYLFTSRLFVGPSGDVTVTRGSVLGLDLADDRSYYFVCLVVLAVCCAALTRLRRSGVARAIIAVRDNEARAASLSVPPALTRLSAFALSGGLAALGGALYAGLLVTFGPQSFRVEESFRVLALVIIGGLGSVGGVLLGAVYLLGVPALFGDTAIAVLLTSGFGILVLLLYLPGGLISVGRAGRDAILRALANRLGPAPTGPAPTGPAPTGPARSWPTAAAHGEPLAAKVLEARGIQVGFGGRQALAGVDLWAAPGEILGLIGANGAGKSTLLGVISGFVTPDAGTVHVNGENVTALAAHERARRGLGRVFQDARLFGELTVHEAVQVALESRERTELVPALLALPPARRLERRRQAAADEHVAFFGLGRYAEAPVATLSTGTRRVVELACLLAQRPSVLLLDEPTAGLAQRETEAFGPLLLRLREELAATMVVVEHDIPLILGISDRVQCLGAGVTIAEGEPEAVRNDPLVIAAYLGTAVEAIERSHA